MLNTFNRTRLPSIQAIDAELERRREEQFKLQTEAQFDAERKRQREPGGIGLKNFIHHFWSVLEPARELVDGWPLDAMCEHLDAVSRGDITKLLINVPPGFMKLNSDLTPILTPDGYRLHGDLKVGDQVFGPDGLPTKILRVSGKAAADYEVTFSTGETNKCNGDHLWRVYDRWGSAWGGNGWKTVDTRWLAEAKQEKDRSRFFIPDTLPLQFPERDLPLHPYFLGGWLGDGSSNGPKITHSIDDMEIVVKLMDLGYWRSSTRVVNATVTSEFWRQGLQEALRELGVFKNKHIPEAYLLSSEAQRRELLAGLIDTDGTVDPKRSRCIYCTCDPRLAEDVQKLVLSLGMRPYLTTMDAPGYGEYDSDKTYFMIGFQPDAPIPTALPRKQITRFDFAKRRRAIVSVKKSDNPEIGHCITVDRPDGLYVVGRTNVVTHNSLLVDVFWPAWEWGPMDMPHLQYVAFSYTPELTERDNAKFRDLILSTRYQELWGDRFSLTETGKRKVTNNRTGFKFATSIRGVGTGERGDRVILDDPHNVKEIESETVREETVRWRRESMANRLNDMQRSAVVIIMQRLHENDVSGEILAQELPYCHLMIPMEFDSSRYPPGYSGNDIGWIDPRALNDDGELLSQGELEDRDGELAWPERFPAATVEETKHDMGPYAWAGQYDQSPRPRKGGIFDITWWQHWEPPENGKFPTMEFIVASLDSAFTEKEENDPSGFTVWGVWIDPEGEKESMKRSLREGTAMSPAEAIEALSPERFIGVAPRLMLMHAWRRFLKLHGAHDLRRAGEPYNHWVARTQKDWGLCEWVAHTCRRFNVDVLLIEAKASGIDVINEMQRLYKDEQWTTIGQQAPRDKVSRAIAVQSPFSQGIVYAPARDWAEMVKSEMVMFPKHRFKDLTDSSTQAIGWLRKNGLIQRPEEIARLVRARSEFKKPPPVLYHA